jgi:hypothetical protein
MRRFPLLALSFLFLAKSAASQTYYVVKFPDDQTVYGCSASVDTVYPVIAQNFNCNFNVGISVYDQVYAGAGGDGCSKIVRRFRLLYWCDYDPSYTPFFVTNPPGSNTGPTVEANPLNHGYLEYCQIIKILDAGDPVFTNCPASPVIFCDYSNNDPSQYNNGNANLCEGVVDLQISATDVCSGSNLLLSYLMYLDLNGDGSMETFVSSSMQNAWPIETTISGNTLTGKVKFQPGQGLPYGSHKIKWVANDKCGNETVCEYLFTVKDCSPPTVVCLHGLSTNIGTDGTVALDDTDFLQNIYDNCTPTTQIGLGIVKVTQSAGVFPAGSRSVSFDCSELGQQEVQLWVKDNFNNASYCQTYVIVDDNFNSCAPATLVGGTVLTDQNKPISGATVQLKNNNQQVAEVVTDDQGKFQFATIPAGCDYLFSAVHSGPADAGLNTLDALLIAAHLDGIKSFDTPYKLLAADTDQSGDLTGADIDALVQIVLGQSQEFPAGAAWKFLAANFQFNDPQNPWSAALPQGIDGCLSSLIPLQPNFIGFKTGDVNGSFQPSLSADPEDRAEFPVAFFYTANVHFHAGETVSVPLLTPDLDGLAGFQFTLDYNPEYLSLQNWTEDLVPDKWIAHFPEEHLLTASWHNSALLSFAGKNAWQNAFTLEFTALQSGWLSDVLKMNSARTAAEVYTNRLETVGAKLDFDRRSRNTPVLQPVIPNPVSGVFAARFYLPEAGDYRLQLVDARGMPISEINGQASAGLQEVMLDPGNHKGMLFIHLRSGEAADVKRVLVE